MRRRRLIVGLGIGVALFVLLMAGGYLALMSLATAAFDAEIMLTDIGKYAEIRNRWSLADHFPPTIPSSATNVRLSSFAGILQGGSYFQVHMSLPAKDVAAIDAKVAAVASHSIQGGGTTDRLNLPTGVTPYYTSGTRERGFPSSFTLHVLKATPGGSGALAWNHGSTAGVAVSTASNEVVYWCESW